jgi:hypothetical protein
MPPTKNPMSASRATIFHTSLHRGTRPGSGAAPMPEVNALFHRLANLTAHPPRIPAGIVFRRAVRFLQELFRALQRGHVV